MSDERFVKLLLRPAIEPSEGMAEYLQRLAKANGFPSLYLLLNSIGVPLNDIVVCGHEKFRAVIEGESPATSLKIPRITKGGISPQTHLDGVFGNARVCCSCLRNTDVLDSAWSDPLSIVCSKHGEVLLDKCPRCSRALKRQYSQYQCACGQDFKTVTSPPSPPWVTRFYELFCPWRIKPPEDTTRSEILRAEIWAARLVRELLQTVTAEVPAGSKAWLYTSEHKILAELCLDDDLLESAVTIKIKSLINLLRYWERKIAGYCGQRPAVFETLNVIRARTRAARQESALLRRRQFLKTADTWTNIGTCLGITIKSAGKAIRDPAWQVALRHSTQSLPNDSLFDCVNRWVSSTYSLDEVRALTGLSGGWLKPFKALYITRLGSSSYSTSRFFKDPVDRYAKGLAICLELGKEISNEKKGIIRIRDFPEHGLKLQEKILKLVADGALPIIGEANSNGSVCLLECGIPAFAVLRLQHIQRQRRHFKALLQSAETMPCHS